MSAVDHLRGTIRSPRFRLPSPAEFLARATGWFRHDTALRRSRRALLDLTDEQLRDVGLSRAEALAEARRSLYLD